MKDGQIGRERGGVFVVFECVGEEETNTGCGKQREREAERRSRRSRNRGRESHNERGVLKCEPLIKFDI